MERSTVQFGTTQIQYTVHRGRREKTVAVAVDPVRGVEVRAPRDTSVERLDEIVYRKAKWILDRRRRQEDLPPPPSPREFVSGETFLYAGRQYRLKVKRGKGNGSSSVRLTGRYLVVEVAAAAEASEIRRRLVAWYRDRAEARIPERVEEWAELLDLVPQDVLIRDQRKRWGSADASAIVRFNWRVVQAPTRLVDYVVAHELVHLKHRDHTRGFWSTLGSAMPDYEVRRERLRVMGRAMVW